MELRWFRPTRPKFNPLVKSLAAWMAANGTTGKPEGAVGVKLVENSEHAMSRFSDGEVRAHDARAH